MLRMMFLASLDIIFRSPDKICDPFWHNELEVAESRTEIWASEVGIGSKNGKRLFSIFSILDISRFISQNFKPQPPPQVPQTEL